MSREGPCTQLRKVVPRDHTHALKGCFLDVNNLGDLVSGDISDNVHSVHVSSKQKVLNLLQIQRTLYSVSLFF